MDGGGLSQVPEGNTKHNNNKSRQDNTKMIQLHTQFAIMNHLTIDKIIKIHIGHILVDVSINDVW